VENVALIKQYQQKSSRKEAHNIVLHYLKKLNLEHIALLRNPNLSEEERFCGMLLRAAMVQSGVLLIYRPFMLLPANKNATFIYKILKNIDDLYTQCFIFDFLWNKHRYGMNDVKEF
jgi:ABC-type nitrate/sulfonate/bicarbonate transport system ATPase subunit